MGPLSVSETAQASAIALKLALSSRPLVLLSKIRLTAGLKWALGLLLLINIKSWPLVCTFRVLRSLLRFVLRYHITRLTALPIPKSLRNNLEERWISTIPKVGLNPFDYRNVYHTRATIDECDFNLHLSNSSYAKVLDASNLECVVSLFPLFWRAGGAMGLGASHFNFIKEIPPMSKFEIRSYIGAWDRKWLYLVSKFVTKPKGPKRLKPSSPAASSSSTNSRTLTEPDGAVVHTIAIVQLCFKAGRRTIPVDVILACNGLSAPPPAVSSVSNDSGVSLPAAPLRPYSRKNPPPHWQDVKKTFLPKYGGGNKKFFNFMAGGWQEDKWWENALSGVEDQRVAALKELDLLREGLEAARNVVAS